MEELVGQGVLDAGKAVDGPAALNARRLEASDVSDDYTVVGKTASLVLYKVDTQGYDSVWANDIKEVRAGLLAADSAEEDLRRRYDYYKSKWLDRTEFESGAAVEGAPFARAYIDFYNDNANASGLVDLSVGLLKDGEGRLTLTGNNTYKGASIARQGTLSIDGSVAGDAYSVEQGTIAGCGTIHGTLYNRNITVAGDATGSGNLTMDKLVSDGVLLSQYRDGTNTQFIVKGEADISGSAVPFPVGATLLPYDKYTVVKAGAIVGTAEPPDSAAYGLTGMLSAKHEIEGGSLSVMVDITNNTDGADDVQNEAFDAMTAMYGSLKRGGDQRMHEMLPLFSMDGAQAKETLSAISSNAAAASMALAQRSMMIHHLLSSRLNEAFMTKPMKVKLPAASLTDNVDEGPEMSLHLPEPARNDIWLKFGKNWGEARGGADYHSSTALLGWDRAVTSGWRAGVFAGCSFTGFADKTAGNELKDTRFGLYAGYSEDGAGVFNQVVNGRHNDYFGMGAGMEFKRYLPGGSCAIRLGVRHAFAGAEPKLRYSYMGDRVYTCDMRNTQDRTHFVLSVGGETEFAAGWSIGGNAGFTRGRHDKDLSCAVTVKRMW